MCFPLPPVRNVMTREEYLFHQRLRVVDYILNEKVKK